MIANVSHSIAGSLTAGELAAWRGMLRTYAAVMRDLDSELQEAHGLALSSYEVLLALNEAPDGCVRMSDLAEQVLLSRSGLTRLADRLERDGLIERRPCPSDARGSLATLTEEGRSRFADARSTHLAGVRSRFLEHFDEHELATLGTYWERLLPGAVTDDGSACG
ncbi:MAG: MarR family transcriptional regulator [Thermoleophilaceae bacterium]|nr:MarR family transcriptional regulator [Thermoleophilaceae bacterium]